MRGDRQEGMESRNKIAYAVVDFESAAWMKKVRRGLLPQWLQEKKLKVKTVTDMDRETHGDRTVVLAALPSHMSPEELAAVVSQYGAVTGIELPTVDEFVQAQIDEKAAERDPFERERLARREQEFRLA